MLGATPLQKSAAFSALQYECTTTIASAALCRLAQKKPPRGSTRRVKRVSRRISLGASLLPTDWLAVLDQFLAGANQRAEAFGKQFGVKRLLERLVDRRTVEAERTAVVG